MAKLSLLSRKRVEVPCTVEINNTFDQLGAHVRFDNGAVVYPGDEVMVQKMIEDGVVNLNAESPEVRYNNPILRG